MKEIKELVGYKDGLLVCRKDRELRELEGEDSELEENGIELEREDDELEYYIQRGVYKLSEHQISLACLMGVLPMNYKNYKELPDNVELRASHMSLDYVTEEFPLYLLVWSLS